MLKTLRITSLIAVVLAVCGVLFIVYLGLKKDPDIVAFLDDPGVVGQFKDKAGTGDNKDMESPLVVQAHEFALRINPPAPPKPVVTTTDPTPVPPRDPVVKREPPKPPQPSIQPPVSGKFTLLATVLCESNPSRSMVLIRQTGKDEWFWQGEKIGNLEVEEVRNGSAVFSQSGRNKQEYFVPAKNETKSLLKNATAAVSGGPTGPGGFSTPAGSSQATDAASGAGSSATRSTSTGAVRIDRSRGVSSSTAAARQEASTSIRRVRTVPVPPTPAEQRESLQESISSIQQIMNRDDGNLSEEQRQQENETWMQLLQALQSEKAKVAEAEQADEGAGPDPADEGTAESTEFGESTEPAEVTDEGSTAPTDEGSAAPVESGEVTDQGSTESVEPAEPVDEGLSDMPLPLSDPNQE